MVEDCEVVKSIHKYLEFEGLWKLKYLKLSNNIITFLEDTGKSILKERDEYISFTDEYKMLNSKLANISLTTNFIKDEILKVGNDER